MVIKPEKIFCLDRNIGTAIKYYLYNQHIIGNILDPEILRKYPKIKEYIVKSAVINDILYHIQNAIYNGGNIEIKNDIENFTSKLQNLPSSEKAVFKEQIQKYLESSKEATNRINLIKSGKITPKELFLRTAGLDNKYLSSFKGQLSVKQYRNCIVFEFEKSEDVKYFFGGKSALGMHYHSRIEGIETIFIDKEKCVGFESEFGSSRKVGEEWINLHETQHSLNKIFMKRNINRPLNKNVISNFNLSDFKLYSLDRAKDEIIAQFTCYLVKNKFSAETKRKLEMNPRINDNLLKEGGCYDYFGNRKNTPEGKRVWEEYKEEVKNMCEYLRKALDNQQPTSYQDILNIFSLADISEWSILSNLFSGVQQN